MYIQIFIVVLEIEYKKLMEKKRRKNFSLDLWLYQNLEYKL